MNISDKIDEIKVSFETDSKTLPKDELYLKYFSKSRGLILELTKILPELNDQDKRVFGPQINKLKKDLEIKLNQVQEHETNSLDETIQIPRGVQGYLHPNTEVMNEMNNFFRYYGYSIIDGPEIETEEYNFRKLNLPEGHPATDLQDTIYLENGILLRTHTSSVETRLLSNKKPPFRVVIPGKVFRNEVRSSTNSSFFYQYQGVVVDKNITIKNLVSTLDTFTKYLFGDNSVMRIRYKYYPEVSPGLGADIRCNFCQGDGCQVCKYRGYVEILGSGMIHYNTMKMCGIDPNEYTGFAFGMGFDRIVMQKYKIPDIRKLYGGELIYK